MADQYQLKALADSMVSAATTINKRVQDEMATHPYQEIEALSDTARDLIIASKTLYAMTAIQIAEEGKKALEQLQDATGKLNKAIKTIQTVQKVIDITAQLILLAGSVVSGDYLSIPGKVKAIIEELGKETEE
ncbi:hypothetical protein GR160_07915 [Flavobacterium sp. Sd200]|uniref:hypothetical protein n=1 Tax=Flavobacterium sp. Sd200 TaxID=2692211 RepID=UPI00136CEE0F|nr:hypothetical protein [Flavobacterium sp. Sd200]MXN91155.1 hypothetical protein [Flavobacterium sp. Sd200]